MAPRTFVCFTSWESVGKTLIVETHTFAQSYTEMVGYAADGMQRVIVGTQKEFAMKAAPQGKKVQAKEKGLAFTTRRIPHIGTTRQAKKIPVGCHPT